MRCPKCHYISFDSGERCRNCGYEFALTTDRPSPDLTLRGDEPIGPFADLSLSPSTPLRAGPPPEADPDLPLFSPGGGGAPAPRPPLAVRRTTPDPARLRHRAIRRRPREDATLDLEFRQIDGALAAPAGPEGAQMGDSGAHAAAPPARRLLAAGVDVVLLSAIDLAVLYFTLRLCGLTPSELHILPAVPFVAFLLLLDGGYIVSLTAAGGQTLGKMLAGLQVVTGAGERVGVGPAVSRAGGYLLSALPAGLGFLPAFLGTDRRALHDRLADTKVVTVQN
jgi:uncharacterized RDD family membrane protein YckC